MTRIVLDSNILIYAELEPDSDKGRRAAIADAKVLLTEDMRDGRLLDQLRLLNPFTAENKGATDSLFAR